MKRIIFLCLSLLLVFAACRKDEISTTTTTTTTSPAEFVKTTIGGQVVDEAGNPVENATVIIGNDQSQTDENGIFLMRDQVVNKKGAYVRVEKSGFFHGSRTITATANTRNTIKIQLLDNTSTQTVDAATGGVADYGDYSVTLPAGGIAVGTADGVDFTGAVGVAAKWLDPTSETFFEQAPGRLIGRSLDGSETGMVSMGMLAVELKASTGAKLQIKNGFQADIRMKVPAELLSQAPSSIPLWHFDEAEGLWIEDGAAELVNGFYEGKVSHFSFWNTDYKEPVVEVKFKVVDSDGNPIEGALVDTRLASDGTFGRGYTNDQGYIWGIVPQGQVLESSVFLPNSGCQNASIMMQIGPFNQGDSMCYTVDLNTLQDYTVTGQLIDCNGVGVTNGYVRIDNNGIVWTDANGNFSADLITCDPLSMVEVVGFDLDALKTSQPISVNVGSGTANAGTINVCDALPEFFTLNDGSGTDTYETITMEGIDSLQTGSPDVIFIAVSAPAMNANGQIQLDQVVGTGSAVCTFFNIVTFGGETLSCGSGPMGTAGNCSQLLVDITEYNGFGGVLEGTYSGELYKPDGTPVQVFGSFKGTLQ